MATCPKIEWTEQMLKVKPPSILARLHYLAVKAAQAYEAATPGTRTKESRRVAWEKAEQKFAEAIDDGAAVSNSD